MLDASNYGTYPGTRIWIWYGGVGRHRRGERRRKREEKLRRNGEEKREKEREKKHVNNNYRDKTGATNQQWVYNTTDSTIRGVMSGTLLIYSLKLT